MGYRRLAHFSPARFLLFSVIATIIIGACILSLPVCRTESITLIDLLFTATSVTCVAGFLTVPLDYFSTIGHVVILILMQIGGLGLITLTLFLMSLFVRLNLSTQLMAGQLLELESWKNIKSIIFFIIGFTFLIEFMGFGVILYHIYGDYPLKQALFYALFHSVSAFCHAGFSLFPHSFTQFQQSPLLLLTIAGIMLCSGVGFLVWYEFMQYIKAWRAQKRFVLSLHSKIVLSVTSCIVAGGTVLFFLLESGHAFKDFPLLVKGCNALFHAIASTGTGLYTVAISEFRQATLLIIMILAFINSSPGSPSSGIKTTTFAIFIAHIKSTILGKSDVSLFSRTIPRDLIKRALAIVSLSIIWIISMLFILLLTEKKSFLDILFELISAFGALGLSREPNIDLSYIGKIVFIMTMIAGRLGPLAFLLGIVKFKRQSDFSYPEERIMIG